jgi:hypothetical protein
MPSDSVAAFLELARELRLLSDADLAPLTDTPDDVELPAVCERLVSAGLLTRYQSDRILTGRGYTLSFAGFPIREELGANTFRAIDPVSRADVRLTRLTTDAAAAATAPHPALLAPLASGAVGAERYAVHPQPNGADLASLVADMGPMPAKLAAEYVRQAAVPLAAAHAAGVVHGHLRVDRLFVGPLVQASKPKADGSPRYRPGPTATVCVADFGLPGGGTPADDVFGLGEALFHLLTGGRPGEVSLAATRPDCPTPLVILVKCMLAHAPAERPPVAEVIAQLTALIAPAAQPEAVQLGKGSSPEVQPTNVVLVDTEPVEPNNDPPRLALADGWAGHPAVAAGSPAFTPQAWAPPVAVAEPEPEPDEPYTPRRATRTAADSSRRTLWVLAGVFLLLVLLGVLTWVALFVFMNSSNKPKAALPSAVTS